ncbi:MAG: flavin monoamine oxidase family protein [Burkholderiales bacterium]
MREERYEIIVLGAGAAGLAAAAKLARSGRRAIVIEARERVGGRIWSHEEPGVPVPIELGAEFIHGRAQPVFDLLARAGSAAVDAGGDHWSLRDGRLVRSQDLFRQVRVAMQRTQALAKHDLPFDRFLDRELKAELTEEARAYARMLAQGFDAADTRRASARAIVEEWTGGGSVEAPQFRPLGGYGRLLAALASELRGSTVDLQLNTAIDAIAWKRGSVEVRGYFLGKPFEARAKRAIVTLPLGVLQEGPRAPGAVRFTPALAAKREALKRLAPGPVLKAVLRFRTAFWETLERGLYRDVAFFHPREALFPTFWTALPVRAPIMVAWAAGPNAERLAGLTKPQIVRHALSSLGALFGESAVARGALEGAWLHDWQRDPYARGAYSYVVVGGDKARAQLAAPLAGTLFFAGEAADAEGEAGTVAGALQSGLRAAREVL